MAKEPTYYDGGYTDKEWQNLNPAIRGFAEVGRFMNSWNFVETEIDGAIGIALSLNPLQEAVISANFSMNGKVSVVTTLLSMTPINAEEKECLRRKIAKFQRKWIPRRNIIAHNGFWVESGGNSVRFFHVKAKGDFELPLTAFTFQQFEQMEDQLDRYSRLFKEVGERFRKAKLSELLANYDPQQAGSFLGIGALGRGLLDVDYWPKASDTAIGSFGAEEKDQP